MLIFFTRRDRDKTVSFFYVRDETETSLDSEFQARPRRDQESQCLFLRDRDENHLLMKKMIEFWLIIFENYTSRSGQDRDETE